MAKPYTHAQSSARKWGGKPEDYLPIHDLLDSSKGALPDHRHRALCHNSWFLSVILEKVFGINITNSDGKLVSVREVGEQHCLEDLGCIPTAQDYLCEMEYRDWMGGKGKPPSHAKIEKRESTKVTNIREVLFD